MPTVSASGSAAGTSSSTAEFQRRIGRLRRFGSWNGFFSAVAPTIGKARANRSGNFVAMYIVPRPPIE